MTHLKKKKKVLYRCCGCCPLKKKKKKKLPSVVCEEIVRNAACLQKKGKGSQHLKTRIYLGPGGFSSRGGNLAICTDF